MTVSQSGQPSDRDQAFWRKPADTLLIELKTKRVGLTDAEADERRSEFGPNRFEASRHETVFVRFGKRLLNPLVAVLIGAALISGINGDTGSVTIIVVVVTLSLILDVVQEYRAEQTADALRRSVAVRADVLRDGTCVARPVETLVPGDVVLLRMGDLVPADGIVLEQQQLQVDESIMTGEAFPASKTISPSDAIVPAEAHNALFASTSVVSGSGTMLVVKTGSQTRFGMITRTLALSAPATALEQGVRRLGFLILRLTLFLTLFVLLALVAAARPPIEAFLFAVALAVGLTPELLPMIMTVTLARGASRMASRQVIVKRLSAIHDLGAMDVLCVDKTGTLTESKIVLTRCIDCNGNASARVGELARVNSQFETGIRGALDEAVLAGTTATTLEHWTRRAELAFDFSRRCLSILAQKDSDNLLICKGACEEVLARTVAIELNGTTQPLDDIQRGSLVALEDRFHQDGFRLLAVAIRQLPTDQTDLTIGDESALTIVGFCIFSDPPKRGAAGAISTLTALGVRLKIISGDDAAVVRHIAAAVGLKAGKVLTGTDIADLTDSALAAKASHIDLFARVDPDQKKRIINALRSRKHVVGFLGDGVNDAPAIHAAHVGLSVDGATDVARAAADMILLAPDLDVLAEGVREGRRTFANILKYVRMGTSSNFGNMLSMALASIALPFLPLLPFQILLNNLLYDLSEIGIPFDEVDTEDTIRPQAWDMAGILRFTLIMGAVSSLFDITTFVILLKVFHASSAEFQTGWFLESIATQILVIFLIRTRHLPWKADRTHPALVATSFGALGLALLLVLSPLRNLLGFTSLTWPLFLTLLGVTACYLVVAEAAKHIALPASQRRRRQKVTKSKKAAGPA